MGRKTELLLQPLRIPSGWTVNYNEFKEIEPEFETFDDRSGEFKEDILQLVHPRAGVIVDLGWYPQHQRRGRFTLLAVRINDDDQAGEWDRPLERMRTRSKQKVVRTIESWLVKFVMSPPVRRKR